MCRSATSYVRWRDQIYDLDEANETEDSETIAIPKDVLSRSVREGAKSATP